MKYYIYESMEQDCDESFDIEAESSNFTRLFLCDDCSKAHPFIQVAIFETAEELAKWQFEHQLEGWFEE